MNQLVRLALMKDMWSEAVKGQAEYISKSMTNYGMYEGGDKQWDAKDIAYLDAKKRHHLSLNIIFPIINLLSGYERQNRLDIKCFPKKGGLQMVAQLMTELAKNIESQSLGLYLRSAAFLDGIVSTKGFLNLDIKYREDPFNGEIITDTENPYDIAEDPNNTKYDLNHGKYVIRSFWADKELTALTYPKVKDSIDDLKYDDLDNRDKDRMPGFEHSPDKFKARLRETWWKSYEKAVYLINVVETDKKRVHKSKIDVMKYMLEKDRRMAEEEGRDPILAVREQVIPVLNCTSTMGDIELENVERPYGEMTKFPIIRFIPYFINGNYFGVIDNLIDPQKEKNKRRSQALGLLNTNANSGFFNKKKGGANTDELQEEGSSPGHVIEYEEVKPTKIEPTQLSTGHIQLEQLAENDAPKIANVNQNMLASGNTSESGIKDRQRINQGLIGSEIIFDNFKYTHKIYSETMIEMIRYGNTFTTQEMMAIASEAKMEANVDQLLEAIRSRKVGRYGIEISNSPTNPTIRVANFDMLLDMAKIYGEIIPPDIVIDASDVAHKEDIVERLKQAQQRREQMEAAAMQAEAQGQGQQTQKKQLAKR